MKTVHEDKVRHLLGNAELREKHPSRASHVLSEEDSKEIFMLRWDAGQALIRCSNKTGSTKAERREWLLALADALEEGLWG